LIDISLDSFFRTISNIMFSKAGRLYFRFCNQFSKLS